MNNPRFKAGIYLGIIAQWATLFLSYRRFPNVSSISDIYAVGGFPLQYFEYPFPPMGSDWPSLSMWGWFIVNLLIWISLAHLVIPFIKVDFSEKKMDNALLTLAITLSIIGFMYIKLHFD